MKIELNYEYIICICKLHIIFYGFAFGFELLIEFNESINKIVRYNAPFIVIDGITYMSMMIIAWKKYYYQVNNFSLGIFLFYCSLVLCIIFSVFIDIPINEIYNRICIDVPINEIHGKIFINEGKFCNVNFLISTMVMIIVSSMFAPKEKFIYIDLKKILLSWLLCLFLEIVFWKWKREY